jgi:hypothetical protein
MEGRLIGERDISHVAASGGPHVVHDGPLGAHIVVIERDVGGHPERASKLVKRVIRRIIDQH